MNRNYRHLQSFLTSWFHQDFDISGNTLDEIVAKYEQSAGVSERQRIVEDIDRYLHHHESAADRTLQDALDLDVDPAAFAPTERDFLMQISEKLQLPS